jgi:hypothetical protein
MKIHIFRSHREPDVYGFTLERSGINLPIELAPWTRPDEAGAIDARSDTLIGIGSCSPVMAAIDRDGFYVARSEIIARHTGLPWMG